MWQWHSVVWPVYVTDAVIKACVMTAGVKAGVDHNRILRPCRLRICSNSLNRSVYWSTHGKWNTLITIIAVSLWIMFRVNTSRAIFHGRNGPSRCAHYNQMQKPGKSSKSRNRSLGIKPLAWRENQYVHRCLSRASARNTGRYAPVAEDSKLCHWLA